MPLDLTQHSHRRLNALTREWVLVSPHRAQRPWVGQVEQAEKSQQPRYDATCYLCPGNARAGGVRNPQYTSTFIFENDFAALRPDVPRENTDEAGLIVAQGEPGICRVMCFTPRHDVTLATMEHSEIRRVMDVWAEQFSELAAMDWVNHVQIFENRGEMMGASNPHPHCQIWGNSTIPGETRKEEAAFLDFSRGNRRCILCEYLRLEDARGERVIFSNSDYLVVVPFWAVWPFETLVIPRRHVGDLAALEPSERDALAASLKRLTAQYDALFDAPFPYSMGFHQRPTTAGPHPEWHLHAHFFPPLLRSATIRKFMVGYELLASPQRDLTPESAAERLRAAQPGHAAQPANLSTSDGQNR